MARDKRRITVVVFALGLLDVLCASGIAAQKFPQKASSVDLQEVLSWLPADTETITVARGPFDLNSKTAQSRLAEDEDEKRPVTATELAEPFQTLPLSSFGFKGGLLLPRLKDKRVSLAIEGARHFRPPSGLGEMPFEGCSIALFVDDLNDSVASFTKAHRKSILRVEQIAGEQIAVFREKLENDMWTAYLAIPDSRTVIVATNRDYLSEVLARLQGKKGIRALPNDLPEWKYINTDFQFWGLRHFDRTQVNL